MLTCTFKGVAVQKSLCWLLFDKLIHVDPGPHSAASALHAAPVCSLSRRVSAARRRSCSSFRAFTHLLSVPALPRTEPRVSAEHVEGSKVYAVCKVHTTDVKHVPAFRDLVWKEK